MNQFWTIIQQTSYTEWFAVCASVIYVVLAAYRKMACWIFGMISSAIYVYICFSSNLFLETGLQVFYIVMSLYGWYNWSQSRLQNQTVIVLRISLTKHIGILVTGLLVSFILGYVFSIKTSQALPYLDASITVFSLVATFMSSHRILENWLYWVVVDFCAIYLYASRDLYLSACLYALFTIMALYGFLQWYRQLKSQA